jgi:hypothetical protein
MSSTALRLRYACTTLTLVAVLTSCQEGMIEIEDVDDETPCTTATPISVGQSMNGTLGTGDCSRSGVWTDRWSLELSSETPVRIDLSSGSFDAFLELHHASGGLIAQNDDAGGLDSRINETLAAGSYLIVARSLGEGQSGSYQLSVAIGTDCSPVGTLEIGDRVSGELSASDCLFEWGGLMDNWQLELARPTEVRIEVESADFDEALVVTDAYGEIQWVLDGFGPLGHARGDLRLGAGSWTLSAVSIFESPGSYELRIDLMPPCLPGKPLALDETYAGTIDDADCLLHDWAPADSLVLDLDRATPLEFVVKSSDFTPFLHVRNRNGDGVAEAYADFNPSTGASTGVVRTSVGLEAGFYSVYVASAGFPSPWGDYQITVNEIACDTTAVLVFDTTVAGTLSTGDCLRAGGAYQDLYQVVIPADTTVRIDLESSAFDAWLTLTDSTGAVIATDDDSGTGLNARIERTLPPGTYTIEAGALQPGSTGDYTLTVAPPGPSPVGSAPASLAVKETAPEPSLIERMWVRDVDDTPEDALRRIWGRAGKAVHIR